MPLPVPTHFDYASEPLSTIEVNEDWYSVLQGIFEFSLNPEFWDGDDSDYANIEQALIGIMTLGALTGDDVQIKVGSYTGDGTADQAIAGVGFQPIVVVLWRRHDTSNRRGIAFRTSGDTDALSIGSDLAGFHYADKITSLDSDGFSVDSSGGAGSLNANANAAVYTYFALGA